MKITIPVPEGLELPDDAQEGSTFDLVANCKLEGGKLVIDAIEGVSLGGEGEKKDEKKGSEEGASPRKGFLESVEERMNPAS